MAITAQTDMTQPTTPSTSPVLAASAFFTSTRESTPRQALALAAAVLLFM